MAAVAMRPAGYHCIRIPAVHVPRPYLALPIRGRCRNPRKLPILATLGVWSPVHTACSPEERGEGGKKRGIGGRPQEHRRRRKDPEFARGPPGHWEAKNHDARHPLLPLLRAAVTFLADDPALHLFTNACTSLVATEVRTRFPAPLWMPRPSSRGGTPPSHRATALAAGDADLCVVLGHVLAGAAAHDNARAR
jgi:hypothetical protein